MMGHKICLFGEIWKIISKYYLLLLLIWSSGLSTQSYIRSFKVIGHLVLEKNIFSRVFHIWAWQPSWSSDHDHLNKLSFPDTGRLCMKYGFDQPSSFRWDIWKCWWWMDWQMMDGPRMPGYTVSSPMNNQNSAESGVAPAPHSTPIPTKR